MIRSFPTFSQFPSHPLTGKPAMSKSPRKNRFAVSMMSLLTASGGQSRGLHGGLLGLCASGLCGVGLLGMGGMGASLG
ncbi:MAG: hypothetical protein ACK55I_10100, partial [bacterium]